MKSGKGDKIEFHRNFPMRKPASAAVKAAMMAVGKSTARDFFDRPFLQNLCGFGQSRDVRFEFIKRGHLPVTDFVPMVLMNPKQIHENKNRVIILDFVLLLPFGEGLQKILVKIGRRCLVGRAHDFIGSNKSATDSIWA